MKKLILLLPISFFLFIFSCETKTKIIIPNWEPYDETEELAQNTNHESPRMQYKLIQSKFLDKNELWKNVQEQINYFSEEDYQILKPLILEQNIPTIQSHIKSGKLTYEKLTQWYLYRIVKFENDPKKSLHSIIALNPNAVNQARLCDKNKSKSDHPIFGMPILLKDNINTAEMKTTAGAHALIDNQTEDAFIVKRIKEKGGIILGKANLSEWAYYFCNGCPLGYSAIGGQTLNPYGRKVFESGGSSAGSGTTMAANYAVAAVGTETSGSIISPSSQNSVVGLKPTIGLLSRSGIVPISSTLDTPGPMTRNVIDNAIFLSAMTGEDASDNATKGNPKNVKYGEDFSNASLEGLRLGVNKNFLTDSIYNLTIEKIKNAGATMVEFEPEEMNFEGFRTFLNADMKIDLPKYLAKEAGAKIQIKSVKDVVEHNLKDTLQRAPYGQGIFEGIVEENISSEDFEKLKMRFENDARNYFNTPMDSLKLDAILSINNYNSGHAAMAKYPCLTVPMGYKESGEPISLTIIAKTFEENKLLQIGYAFEQATKMRKMPNGF
ncbi:MAG: amidase family protein [Saprospiraceae bacterium]